MTAMTDFYENKTIDFNFRGLALGINGASAAAGTGPTTWFIGLIGVAGTDATVGTELSGGAYARVPFACTVGNWANTQNDGTNAASTGTSGTTSNKVAIAFPTSTSAWGTAVEWGAFDSLTGGNECIRGPLQIAMAIGSANITPSFPAGTLTYQVDN